MEYTQRQTHRELWWVTRIKVIENSADALRVVQPYELVKRHIAICEQNQAQRTSFCENNN
ncbi:MAG: hypothetical protein RR827_07330 [Oscillospiraceae bacterium]